MKLLYLKQDYLMTVILANILKLFAEYKFFPLT